MEEWKLEMQDAATVDGCSGKIQAHPSEELALGCGRCFELGYPLKGMGHPSVVETGNGGGTPMGNLREGPWDLAGGGGSLDKRAFPD